MRGYGEPVDILLVEDNPGDARLTGLALARGELATILHHVWTGEEALEFLGRRGRYPAATRPDLMLLDLNLPGLGGRGVLEHVKADPELMNIPVIVLTSSANELDIAASYAAHANCFVTKPICVAQFMTVVRVVQEFWINTVRLPSIDPPTDSKFY